MLQEITVLTGFRACGKSKIAEIIMAALNGFAKVRFIDMSDAIKYFLARPQVPLGKELQQYRHIMDDGGVIPDGHLIYTLCLTYLKVMDHEEGKSTEHLILAGGFRTVAEAACFLDCKVPVTVVHIVGDYNDMLTGVQRRIDAGVVRTDSMSLEKLQRGWHDYHKYVIPALKLVDRSRYHKISYKSDMRTKIESCIDVIPFPPAVKNRMKRRICSGNHNACIMIEALDHPVPQSEPMTHKIAHPHPAHLAPAQAEADEPNKSTIHVRIHPVAVRTAAGFGLIS